jgi:uracil-DNA glycosylase
VLRAFKQPFADVRVLIVGQDPYPTPGNPVGLSFSVAPEVKRLPGSLVNIFREYSDDLGYPTPSNGDLTPWAERGVLLLNRVLTVAPGKPGSHRGQGWEEVTEQAIRALAARETPLVAILWGRDARTLVPLLDGVPPVLGEQRFLRLPPVQPGQSAARPAGRRAGGLEAALVSRPWNIPKGSSVTPADRVI